MKQPSKDGKINRMDAALDDGWKAFPELSEDQLEMLVAEETMAREPRLIALAAPGTKAWFKEVPQRQGWSPEARHWIVRVKTAFGTITSPYSHGKAHGDTPCLASFINCIASDLFLHEEHPDPQSLIEAGMVAPEKAIETSKELAKTTRQAAKACGPFGDLSKSADWLSRPRKKFPDFACALAIAAGDESLFYSTYQRLGDEARKKSLTLCSSFADPNWVQNARSLDEARELAPHVSKAPKGKRARSI